MSCRQDVSQSAGAGTGQWKGTTMKMAPIRDCQVTDCCYHMDEQCHAPVIQVGDNLSHPLCAAAKWSIHGRAMATLSALLVSD